MRQPRRNILNVLKLLKGGLEDKSYFGAKTFGFMCLFCYLIYGLFYAYEMQVHIKSWDA